MLCKHGFSNFIGLRKPMWLLCKCCSSMQQLDFTNCTIKDPLASSCSLSSGVSLLDHISVFQAPNLRKMNIWWNLDFSTDNLTEHSSDFGEPRLKNTDLWETPAFHLPLKCHVFFEWPLILLTAQIPLTKMIKNVNENVRSSSLWVWQYMSFLYCPRCIAFCHVTWIYSEKNSSSDFKDKPIKCTTLLPETTYVCTYLITQDENK